ncbi:hypothetical protein ASPZODRAFT_147153 [Penicilliopsis zonata CBS 506.65]|uniref:Uncharacterized protein n=1 Tax=Penicilliopsis zonata CBS 506.65 TaxID=1073090 RepID=A0A1L9S6G5_9EURO|nr:hypothetical protein ASPZODRAFT_147153 [Penicilliopsis zonata CBS 506.65]OJJ42758.1 hypothetical protein ASPZODRAFT_147153 [Penicilliopsis zonata CBS 506.65]
MKFPGTLDVPDEDTYVFGSHLYFRSINAEWETILALLHQNGPNIRYFHLYCDTLTARDKTSSSLHVQLPATLCTFWIFARDFFSDLHNVTWELPPTSTAQKIYLYCDRASPSLVVSSAHAQRPIALFHAAAECPDSATEPTHRHVQEQAQQVPQVEGLDGDKMLQSRLSNEDVARLVAAVDATAAGGYRLFWR